MTEDQKELLEEARDSIKVAKIILKEGFPGFAASRAYYAMFYVAEAFLEGEEMAFSKHMAVISAFGQHFAKTGKVPPEFHRYLLDAYELRYAGDYGPRNAVSNEQAKEQISHAENISRLAERLIGPISSEK